MLPDSRWCDKATLLQNAVDGPQATLNMPHAAKQLGLRVVMEYELGYHPQGGDYVCAVAGPWEYRATAGGVECVASDWAQLFNWVRRECARQPG